jgi:hypothetical protein
MSYAEFVELTPRFFWLDALATRLRRASPSEVRSGFAQWHIGHKADDGGTILAADQADSNPVRGRRHG